MTEYVRTIQLGAAMITIINIGNARFNLAEALNVSESEWSPRYSEFFARPLQIPIQCIHISLPTTSVLIDAGFYDIPQNSPLAIPGYQPPPGLLVRLAEANIQPEQIAHVIITHGHFDHYNGTTLIRDGQNELCFPNARHYLGRSDWERPETQSALQNPDSTEGRSLAVLHGRGLLQLVEGDQNLGNGIKIIAAPGETPGHQIVRIHSEGQTLYCLGDLYHHPVEVEQPTWMVSWADVETTLTSRHALVEAALAEDALLVATHIPTSGRLQRTASGATWVDV